MQTKLYRIEDDASLSLQSREDISADWAEDEAKRWLAIEEAASYDLIAALACFKLDTLILEALTEKHPAPRIALHDRAVLISYPIFQGGSRAPAYLTLLLLPTTLITLTLDSNPAVQRLGAELTRSRRLFEPTVQALLYAIFDILGDLSVEPFFECRQKLAEQLEDDPLTFDLSDMLENKRVVTGLITTVEDQLYCVNALTNVTTNELANSQVHQRFRDMVGILTHAQRALHRIEFRTQDLHQHYLLTLQNTTNRRLKVLTVLSTIYLPSTLIAGIYGMNFHNIPALELSYGYVAVLATMILLVIGQIGFFYWRGWFR